MASPRGRGRCRAAIVAERWARCGCAGRGSARAAAYAWRSSSRLPKGSSTWQRRDPGRASSAVGGVRRPRAGAPRAPQVVDDQAGMRLAGGRERLLDADVELLLADAEPAAAARPQRLRLRQLLEAEQLAVERARRRLAPGRRRDLDVVDPDDRSSRTVYHRRVAQAQPPLEDTLVSGYARLASDAPNRRIDLELRRARHRARVARSRVVALPIALLLALVVLVTSGRPVLYRGHARRPGGPVLHDAEVPDARQGRRGADRPVPRRGARPPHRGRADADRPLAEGVAARRGAAALERPPR